MHVQGWLSGKHRLRSLTCIVLVSGNVKTRRCDSAGLAFLSIRDVWSSSMGTGVVCKVFNASILREPLNKSRFPR